TTEDVETDLTETSCRRVCDPAEIPVVHDRDNSHPPSPTFHRSSVDRSFLEQTSSNNEDEEDEEDVEDEEDDKDKQDPTWRSPPEPDLDFGASILAARPLVQAQPPPYPFLPGSLCKHPRDDGGDEGERRDGKRRRQEPEFDFGASILASRPLVLLPPPPPSLSAFPPARVRKHFREDGSDDVPLRGKRSRLHYE
ncbi:hypothetical protein DFQ26_001693, partial [Actinomortierella ambigua]